MTRLAGKGLVAFRAENVTLTAAGASRYAGLRGRIDAVTARVFARSDPQRVETARALLQEIAGLDTAQLAHESVTP